MAKSYPIRSEKQLSLVDLGKLPLIIRDGASRRGITEALLMKLQSLGCRPNIAMRCESPESIKTAVSKKMGVGILYQDALTENSARGLFKQLRVSGLPTEGKIYIVSHKQRPLSNDGETFIAMIRECCEVKRSKAKSSKAHAAASVFYLLYAAAELLPAL